MSKALVEKFAAATGALSAAMKQADLSAIEQATADFRKAMVAIQAVESWDFKPELKARFAEIIAELDDSRMLACLMGDVAGQRHGAIASRNLDIPQPLYKPAR